MISLTYRVNKAAAMLREGKWRIGEIASSAGAFYDNAVKLLGYGSYSQSVGNKLYTKIYENVYVGDNTVIGSHCRIKSRRFLFR